MQVRHRWAAVQQHAAVCPECNANGQDCVPEAARLGSSPAGELDAASVVCANGRPPAASCVPDRSP
jgi:hypothetical protein